MRSIYFTVAIMSICVSFMTGCNQSDDLAKLNKEQQAQNDASQYFEQANTLCMQGEYEKAIDSCTRALELTPEFANGYTLRGRAYANLGQYKKALTDFDTALRLNPDYILTHFFMGNTYAEMGDKKAAVDAFHAFIQRTEPDLAFLQQQAKDKISELENAQ